MGNKSNQLVGLCPICSAVSGADEDDISDAYVSSTIGDSDKYMPLLWSEYYQDYVCRECVELGKDKVGDKARHDRDKTLEQERQAMGFVKTYTTN